MRRGGVAGLALLLCLSGCGGGSGGGAISTPTPPTVTPTPTPAPTPTPTPSTFDTAEYRRSNGAVAAQALAAYQAGASGRGIIAAVIDSGVNPDLPEFAGRISPLSRDVAGSRALADESGHGSEVSGILLAARNNSGIHGVAPAATLLALRADRPGSCAGTDGCAYSSTAIANGLDVATSAGARVANISLGGFAAPFSLQAALVRAGNAGIVTVVAAGNDSAAESDALARSLVAAAVPNTVIVAGAVDDAGVIADFSNRAGSIAVNYLVALGVRVRSFDATGAAFLYSGTSEAAPIISGAVALMAEAFPTLSGPQIVDILFRTATDLGAPGTDAIYGRGQLNIARAFAPIGSLSVAGVAEPLASAAGVIGGPLGDAGATGLALRQVAARDSYGRGYAVDVAAGLRRQSAGRLAQALFGSAQAAGLRLGDGEVAVLARAGDGLAWRGDQLTGADTSLRPQAALTAGAARLPLAPGRSLAFGYGQSLTILVGGAGDAPVPLVAARADDSLALAQPLAGGALVQQMGGWRLGIGYGTLRQQPAVRSGVAPLAQRALLRLDRQLGGVQLGLGGEMLVERGSLLGSQLAPAFGVTGSTTLSALAHVGLPLGRWTLAADARLGQARPDLTGSGLIHAGATLTTFAGALQLWGQGLLRADDRVSLTLAQPLRASGHALLALGDMPLATALAPSGREIAVEAGYMLSVAGGALGLTSFWRHQPGHIATAPPDAGAAVQFRLGF